MRFQILTVVLLSFISLKSYSQNPVENNILDSLLLSDSTQTPVLIQDTSLTNLLHKHARLNQQKGISGYRIQIFSASGHDARIKARKAQANFLSKFPDVDTYLIYHQPYFKIRVGDFRSKKEGFYLFKQILKYFPSAYFVIENEMNYPKLNYPEKENSMQ